MAVRFAPSFTEESESMRVNVIGYVLCAVAVALSVTMILTQPKAEVTVPDELRYSMQAEGDQDGPPPEYNHRDNNGISDQGNPDDQ